MRRAAARAILILAVVGWGAGGARLDAQASAEGQPFGVGVGIEITRPVEVAFLRLRELLAGWVDAESAGRAELADERLQDLLGSVRQVSFHRLPDAAAAAGLLAIRAAAAGNSDALRRALTAAEAFDPGAAANSYAAAQAARARGAWPTAIAAQANGLVRVFQERPLAALVGQNALLGLLLTLLFSGLLVVVSRAVTRGGRAWRRLRSFLEPSLPLPLVWVVAVALLFWPLLLPAGMLWLCAYWAILLWTDSRPSERVVLAIFLGLVCLGPLARSEFERRWSVNASSAVRVLDHLAADRLAGTFLADLAALQQTLPNDPAVRQVMADVHRRLGQWDEARVLYASLVEGDPDNTAAVLGLGAYYSAKGDFRRGVEWFRKASEVDPQSAEAFFNLSQAYNSSYLFEDSRRALAMARTIDERRVASWIGGSEVRPWVVPEAAVLRRDEIVAGLHQLREPESAFWLPPWALSLVTWCVLMLLALAAQIARQRRALSGEPGTTDTASGRLAAFSTTSARILVPGLTSIEEAHGLRAFFAWLPVAILLLWLGADGWAHRLPIPFPGAGLFLGLLVAVLLVFWVLGRIAWISWRES